MTMYKIAYVDESEPDIRQFQRYARNYFVVVPIKPDANIENTVAHIFESHVDAVVSDFDLSEQDEKVHYNGASLISQIIAEKENFPVFVLTSYEDDAVSKGDDVNIVYEKLEISKGEKFLEKVKAQIEKYKHKIDSAEERLLALLEKNKTKKLTAKEEEEVLKLDAFIEQALDKKSYVPDQIKSHDRGKELKKLLEKVDELTKKIGKK